MLVVQGRSRLNDECSKHRTLNSERSTLNSERSPQPLEVFRDLIEFKVHPVSRPQLVQIRQAPCVRDNPIDKPILIQSRNRKADSVDCDGSFKNDVLRKIPRQLDLDPV